MSAKIIDGKVLAEQSLEFVKEHAEKHDRPPCLVIYHIGDDPASEVYVRSKIKTAERCGINAIIRRFDEDVNLFWVTNRLEGDAGDPNIDGIMIQLPLPKGWNERPLIERIPPTKDVDGLTYTNMGRLHKDKAYHKPCTAFGIMLILEKICEDLTGKHAVVVGRSEIVGKPVAQMLLNLNATVTTCHSKTADLASFTKTADILIVATGKRNLITADMVKPGAIVIDVGINRDENGKLCGDVDFENVKEVAGAITPVPGGVGPMTVAMLMMNTLCASYYIKEV